MVNTVNPVKRIWEKGQCETGHFKMFQGRRDISIIWETGHSILWDPGHFIIWETGHSILWEEIYPLGSGPLILWDPDRLSSGIRDTLWETDRGKRTRLPPGIRTRLPSGIRPLGSCYLGDGFQPFKIL